MNPFLKNIAGFGDSKKNNIGEFKYGKYHGQGTLLIHNEIL